MEEKQPAKLYASNLNMKQCRVILQAFEDGANSCESRAIRENLEIMASDHNFDLPFYLKSVRQLLMDQKIEALC